MPHHWNPETVAVAALEKAQTARDSTSEAIEAAVFKTLAARGNLKAVKVTRVSAPPAGSGKDDGGEAPLQLRMLTPSVLSKPRSRSAPRSRSGTRKAAQGSRGPIERRLCSAPHLGRRRSGHQCTRGKLLSLGEDEKGEEGTMLPTAAAISALDAEWHAWAPFEVEFETCSEPSTCGTHSVSTSAMSTSVDLARPVADDAASVLAAAEGEDGEGAAIAQPNGLAVITDEEMEMAKRMFADFGQAPSDHPEAALLTKANAMPRVWRYRPQDAKMDVWVLDMEVPVRTECFIAMSCGTTSRTDWDETSKEFRVLSAHGPTSLAHLHGECGDFMNIYWLSSMPFPLPNREYYLERKLCEVPPLEHGAPRAYLKIDRCLDAHKLDLQAPVARRAVRVTDYSQWQLIWPGNNSLTLLRTYYSENPMMPIPSWIVTFMTEKVLPKGLKAMAKAAVEYEQKYGPAIDAAAAAMAST